MFVTLHFSRDIDFGPGTHGIRLSYTEQSCSHPTCALAFDSLTADMCSIRHGLSAASRSSRGGTPPSHHNHTDHETANTIGDEYCAPISSKYWANLEVVVLGRLTDLRWRRTAEPLQGGTQPAKLHVCCSEHHDIASQLTELYNKYNVEWDALTKSTILPATPIEPCIGLVLIN